MNSTEIMNNFGIKIKGNDATVIDIRDGERYEFYIGTKDNIITISRDDFSTGIWVYNTEDSDLKIYGGPHGYFTRKSNALLVTAYHILTKIKWRSNG